MKLHTRLILSLAAVVFAVMVISQIIQYQRTSHSIAALSKADLAVMSDLGRQGALNLFHAINGSVRDSLERGEMEKFRRLLLEQKKVKGLLNFALLDTQGKFKYASNESSLGSSLSPQDWKDLVSRPETVRETSDAMEIFHKIEVVHDCVRCHANWSVGQESGGALFFRYSNEAERQAAAEGSRILSAMKRSALSTSALAICMVLGMLSVCMYFLIRKFVGRPIEGIAARLKDASDRVATAANEVAASSEALAQGSTEQASSIAQTASSLDHLSLMARNNSDSAGGARSLAESVESESKAGFENMEMMLSAVHDIMESSQETEKIVKTIDEIAFQTNLLALNAAVEAARAGEAGKGFAVVAEEVRNLAQRSSAAANETSEKIEVSRQHAERGVSTSENVSASLSRMREASAKTAQIIKNIWKASEEQASDVGSVNTVVNDLEKTTQSNSASAEQSAAASAQLVDQSSAMSTIVQDLTALVYGKKKLK